MREAWRGWAFLAWRPWIELRRLLCSAARHKGLIIESFARHCKCYYISSLHSLHVIVEKNLSVDVITYCIECFLCNLKKQAPIWQLSLNGNRKHDTAAVGRTFLRSPPPAPLLSCCSGCSSKLSICRRETPFGTRGGAELAFQKHDSLLALGRRFAMCLTLCGYAGMSKSAVFKHSFWLYDPSVLIVKWMCHVEKLTNCFKHANDHKKPFERIVFTLRDIDALKPSRLLNFKVELV